MRRLCWQRFTDRADHFLYFEVNKHDLWIGIFWRYERGRWGSTLDVWIGLLPCLPLYYQREGR